MKIIVFFTLVGTLLIFICFPGFGDIKYSTGISPHLVTTADVNNNGLVDLIVSSRDSFEITVLENLDMGRFWNTGNILLSHRPTQVTAYDINNDTFVDMIVSGYDGDVSVLFGNGDGTFMEPVLYRIDGQLSQTVICDIDGDRAGDMIVSNVGFSPWWNDEIIVLLNKGNGMFANLKKYETGRAPQKVMTADVNNDGFLDMLVSNQADDDLSVLINDGDGSLLPQIRYDAGYMPGQIVVSDLNRDGYLDMMVSNYKDNDISVLINRGDGTFFDQVKYDVGDAPSEITVSDVDMDGYSDILVSNYKSDDISVLINSGDGAFAPQVVYETGIGPMQAEACDINNDEFPDMLVSNSKDNDISVLINRGDGTFVSGDLYYVGNNPSKVTCVDINNDRYEDIVVTNYSSNDLSVLINQGDGKFGDTHPYLTIWFDVSIEPSAKLVFAHDDNIKLLLDVTTPRLSTRLSDVGDLYIVMIHPDGSAYSGLSWDEGIRPAVKALEFPSNKSISDISFLETTIPSLKPPIGAAGSYTFAIAVFRNGSSELISNIGKLQFQVVD